MYTLMVSVSVGQEASKLPWILTSLYCTIFKFLCCLEPVTPAKVCMYLICTYVCGVLTYCGFSASLICEIWGFQLFMVSSPLGTQSCARVFVYTYNCAYSVQIAHMMRNGLIQKLYIIL